MTTRALHTLENYVPPSYASKLPNPPRKRFLLGLLPTPIHPWKFRTTSSSSSPIDLYIKRDDLTGCELSGNKVRKLEFLVADALAQNADALSTVGGIQSNHARATAAAASAAGLACHLVLRTRKADVDKDPGFQGNLLIERLLGAQIHLVSKEDYASAGEGGFPLLVELGEKLVREKKVTKPYLIPLGGSNALGAWGYVEASREIVEQAEIVLAGHEQKHFDVVVMATGSAGTAAGLSLGLHLAGSPTKVRAYCVCDDPDYFYEEIQKHLDELVGGDAADAPNARDIVTVVQARGAGYAISRPDELELLRSVAASSSGGGGGVLLDPVYTGKAAKQFFDDVANEGASSWSGKKVLFLHTGGLFGLYGATEEVTAPLVGQGVEAFRKA